MLFGRKKDSAAELNYGRVLEEKAGSRRAAQVL